MQLIYIWVEEFRCFKNDEFNFSSKFKFRFNYQDNSMEINYNDNNTLLLFKNNKQSNLQDITVIVGENGVGKTTISDLLIEPVNLSKTASKRIYMFKDNEGIYSYCTGNWDNSTNVKINFHNMSKDQENQLKKLMSITNDELNLEILEGSPDNIIVKGEILSLVNDMQKKSSRKLNIWFKKNIDLIYDSNTFSYQSEIKNNEYSGSECNDISLGSKYLKNSKTYFDDEFRCQMDFIVGKGKLFKKEMDFIFPNTISIKIYDNRLESFYPKENNSTFILELVNEIEKQNIGSKHVIMFTLFMYMNYILLKPRISLDKDKKNNELDTVTKQYIDLFEKKFIHMSEGKNLTTYKGLINIVEFLYDESIKFFEQDIEVLKQFRDIIGNIKTIMHNLSKITFRDEKQKAFYKEIDVSSKKKLNDFYTFYKIYRECMYLEKFIGFNWIISTGENAFLNIMSKYDDINKKLNNKSVLIFIDEADLYLHPRWQQRYISLLIKSLQIIFKEKKVQLIITTHSPIILSDIPKNHVIFMTKDNIGNVIIDDLENHNETFSGNIFDLYNDSFFLSKDEKGDAIGRLANDSIEIVSGKLSEIKNEVDMLLENDTVLNIDWEKYKSGLEYCKCVISVLGDPVYYIALKSQYDWIESFRKKFENDKEYEARRNAILNIDKMKLDKEQSEIIRAILERNNND